MPQLQFGPNLTTAGINIDFPITALNQRDVIGFDFQNFSPFPLRLHGAPAPIDYHLWPFQGVYIPEPVNALSLEVAQQYYPTSQTTFTSSLIAKKHVDAFIL